VDILAIAAEMLNGEVEYRRGSYASAFEHLRRAVKLADEMPYDEPWGWMQPARHALGALLLEQGHIEEAETAYRDDLGLNNTLIRACQHPENVWSLHGLHECLVRQDKLTEAAMIAPRLSLAQARADVAIKSSCLCRLQHSG
jgi:tetratricopeptide (TPR) repeat protein